MRLVLTSFAALALVAATHVSDRPIIRTESDLPAKRFAFDLPPSEMMTNDGLLKMLPAMRLEGERLLRDYQIVDSTIVQKLRLGLANIALLEGRKGDATELLVEYRAGETKPQRKLLGGLATDLAIHMGETPEHRCTGATEHLNYLLAKGDPIMVRDQVLGSYSDLRIASVPFYAATAAGLLDPVVAERKSLNVLQAMDLVRWRVAATSLPLCREAFTTATRQWIENPANRPVDIWPDRQPSAAAFANVKSVVVAVWDRGYDSTLFPGQLARDPAEPLDGRDNDGNGIVDDWNGLTYGVDLEPTEAVIQFPTHFLQQRLAAQRALEKGELDLRFGLDTPEAELFAHFARTAPTNEQADEFLASMEDSGLTHGTACASEIADGAPYVRLYNIAALPWGRGEDKHDIPYDEATINRWARAIDLMGARLRGANVRVVSMSWGLTADEIGQQLLDLGPEADPIRAKARGLAMRQTIADALYRLMASSPNILFVVAAGNSDQSADVQGDAAKSFNVANMIFVGATGSSGRPTSFTVFGQSVSIYALGEAVPLRWPGNILLHESGTSMAAPLVARAAAQMLAVRPTLSAAQVRDGLLLSASSEEGGLRLLNPKLAVAWAFKATGTN